MKGYNKGYVIYDVSVEVELDDDCEVTYEEINEELNSLKEWSFVEEDDGVYYWWTTSEGDSYYEPQTYWNPSYEEEDVEFTEEELDEVIEKFKNRKGVLGVSVNYERRVDEYDYYEELETTIVEDLRVKKKYDNYWSFVTMLYILFGTISVVCSYFMKNNGHDINYLLYVVLWFIVVFVIPCMLFSLPFAIRNGKKFHFSGNRNLGYLFPSIVIIASTIISISYFLMKVIKLEMQTIIVIDCISILLSIIYSVLSYLKIKNQVRTNEWKDNYNINPVELSLIKSRQVMAGIDPDKFPPYSREMLNLNIEEWRYLKTELELAGYNISKRGK